MTTYPVFSVGELLTADDMNAVGLWRITSGITATTTGAGSSATVSNGNVTISGNATAVTISGAFSADFDNYKITYTGGSGSTLQVLALQLDGSTTGYYGTLVGSDYTVTGNATSNSVNNAASWTYAGIGGITSNFLDVALYTPYLAEFTGIWSPYVSTSTIGYGGTFTGFHNSATSYTGFKIIPTGTITGGTIRVYGYRN